jgi:hypothetical protein
MSLPVTDHAIVRYLERAKGVDIEAIRLHIWKTCEGAVKIGATCLRAEGVKFEFTNGKVITVAPDGLLPSKISRAASQRKMQQGVPKSPGRSQKPITLPKMPWNEEKEA